MRIQVAVLIVAVLAVVALGARPQTDNGRSTVAHTLSTTTSAVPVELPGKHLPIVGEHTYRMAGKIRVFLLWVGRDDVGSGVIKWRREGEQRAFEVLIGTDPQKAPSQLNKWGFLVEEIRADESSVVGLMSEENDDKLSDVKADLKKRKDLRAFDTIRGFVMASDASARVGNVYAPSVLTYRNADTVLKTVLADTSLAVKRLPRHRDVRAGFLSSLNELIAANIEGKPLRRIPYIHGDGVYELRLVESTPLARFERDGRTFEKVIRARFETGRAGTRSGTRFELVYGASGPLTGVPILISYQPKWWLQVDLVLHT
jgi:hypothetical protein